MMPYASSEDCIWSTLLVHTLCHNACSLCYSESLLKSVLKNGFVRIFNCRKALQHSPDEYSQTHPHQRFCYSRNIGQATWYFLYFHCLWKSFADRSIQTSFLFQKTSIDQHREQTIEQYFHNRSQVEPTSATSFQEFGHRFKACLVTSRVLPVSHVMHQCTECNCTGHFGPKLGLWTPVHGMLVTSTNFIRCLDPRCIFLLHTKHKQHSGRPKRCIG